MPHSTKSPTNLQHRTKPLKSALRRTQSKSVHRNALTEVEHEHHHPASESEAGPELDGGSESVSDESVGDAQDDEDVDVDAPRVVQWADSQDEDSEEETDEDTNVLPIKPSQDLRSLEDDLSSLPLGMLRKAQHALSQTRALTDSESESESDAPSEEDAYPTDDERPQSTTSKGKDKDKEHQDKHSKPRKDLAKRSSKHAPTEITSKRPVTRRRTVIESKAPVPRDPRFLHITGTYDPQKFKSQYTFLSTLHTSELSTLRSNLTLARKLLLNSPKDLRAEREREVGRLELAVKRAESSVNRDKREKVEMEALERVGREEREKRKKGKAGWWMKSTEKKELLMKARYDAIASSGGKRAVKKAIEKKQKKQSQKEKRSRPFPAPGHAPSNSKNTSISTGSNNINIGSGSAQKRARFTVDEERTQPSKKRRKF
jgi:ribosomal RNA-processing protein 36